MTLGIVQPKAGGHVPGTVQLFEDRDESAPSALRHGIGRDSEIVLVPQPSESPNDPLNWPLWKRDLTLFVICLAGSIAGILGPAIAPINGVLVKEFKTNYHEVATWSGWQFWSAGVAGLVCSAVGRVWGKRPVYLASISLCLAGGIWNATTHSSTGFLWSRTVQGFGLGAFETIIPTSVGDMYYVHERGKRIAFYNLAFLGTTYFMPILGGYITMKHGWRMQFIIISVFLGVSLLLAIFLLPEHVYNRPAIFETDISSQENLSELKERLAANERESAVDEKKKSWVQELKIYNGRFTEEKVWKALLAPLVLFFYPATIWAFLFQGLFISWGIGVSVILAQLFAGPPNNFGPEKLGYMYCAPFIGALTSFFAGSMLSDYLAKRMAKRNGNMYEPEFRILLVIPAAVTSMLGLFLFGYLREQNVHWIGPSVCYGLITFAVVMSCISTFGYILDAHRDISIEMMVSLLLLKNFFAWGSTYFLTHMVEKYGPADMFYIIGGIMAGVCLLSVLMYTFGKLQRDFLNRHNLLKNLGLYPKVPAAVAH